LIFDIKITHNGDEPLKDELSALLLVKPAYLSCELQHKKLVLVGRENLGVHRSLKFGSLGYSIFVCIMLMKLECDNY